MDIPREARKSISHIGRELPWWEVLRSLQPDSLNIAGKCSDSLKEKQKQPLLGCLQLLSLLVAHKLPSALLKKKKK